MTSVWLKVVTLLQIVFLPFSLSVFSQGEMTRYYCDQFIHGSFNQYGTPVNSQPAENLYTRIDVFMSQSLIVIDSEYKQVYRVTSYLGETKSDGEVYGDWMCTDQLDKKCKIRIKAVSRSQALYMYVIYNDVYWGYRVYKY